MVSGFDKNGKLTLILMTGWTRIALAIIDLEICPWQKTNCIQESIQTKEKMTNILTVFMDTFLNLTSMPNFI